MIGWHVKVHKNGQELSYSITPKVVVAWERKHNLGLAKAFSHDQRMELLFSLAYECIKASGETVKLFDEWLEEIEWAELDVAGVDNRPLDKI